MARVLKSGQMELDTKVFGEKIRLMVKENSGMSMETSLRENGKMIKPMDLVFTLI